MLPHLLSCFQSSFTALFSASFKPSFGHLHAHSMFATLSQVSACILFAFPTYHISLHTAKFAECPSHHDPYFICYFSLSTFAHLHPNSMFATHYYISTRVPFATFPTTSFLDTSIHPFFGLPLFGLILCTCIDPENLLSPCHVLMRILFNTLLPISIRGFLPCL